MRVVIKREGEMTRTKRWYLGLGVVLGLLAIAAGCARFGGQADFSADPTDGKAPLTVTFTPLLCAGIDRYVWSFGDGTTSTERSPEHIYAKAGTYTVTLMVTPRHGDPTAVMKEDYISVRSGFSAGRITPIYWTEEGKHVVQRCLRDGSYVQALDVSIDTPGDVTVLANGVYWADTGRGEVAVHDLLTSTNTVLASGRDHPYGVAADGQNGRAYWTELYANVAGTDGMVMYVTLGGGSATSLLQTMGRPFDIEYDATWNKLYWTQQFATLPRSYGSGGYGIAVRDLSSSTIKSTILSGLSYVPYGIAIDSDNGKIYWTGGDAIHRCNLDGTGVETIVDDADSPRGIAVDPELGKIYWGEDGRIREANLDGTGVGTILDGLGQVIGLDLG
jgi:PKD repeat protein